MKLLAYLFLLSSFTVSPSLNAKSVKVAGAKKEVWKTELVSSGHDVIWSVKEISNDQLIFTTRVGNFYLLDLKTKKTQKISASLKVFHQGQGGLMDISLHPLYKQNHKVYFTYSCAKEKGSTTCLASATLDLNKNNSSLKSIKEIFVALPVVDSSLQFGSRLTWDDQQNLFISIGDRYSQMDQAQQLGSHLGKILRLTDSGKAAPGNPFENQTAAKPEIYSLGHRNQQGLFFDPQTKILWENEHGPKGGDEINRVTAGKNYGWPIITYGMGYDGSKIGIGTTKDGLEQPIHYYVPSIATSSLMVYSGKKYADLKGHLFSGALVSQHINVLEVNSENTKVKKEIRIVEHLKERIRDITETADGNIFFSTDSGKIYLLTYSK